MSSERIYAILQDILSMINMGEYPQTRRYLESLIREDDTVAEDPYEIANHLLQCDRPFDFPEWILAAIEQLFLIAFEAGNADAVNDLGAQYYLGNRGFRQNFAKAVQCYQIAAANGSLQAQENLGYCYYYGRDLPIDYKKAFHYFALGAFKGYLNSLYKIGDMYLNGYYVEKNPKEAYAIYSRCMETMTDEAAERVAGPIFLRLGKCLLGGLGTEPDPKSALICFQKAESFLYDMVANGDELYRGSLREAVEGQERARAALAKKLEKNFPGS